MVKVNDGDEISFCNTEYAIQCFFPAHFYHGRYSDADFTPHSDVSGIYWDRLRFQRTSSFSPDVILFDEEF
jgi:hypothetical protein